MKLFFFLLGSIFIFPAKQKPYLLNLANPNNTFSMDGIRLEAGSPRALTDGDPTTIWRKLPFPWDFVILSRFKEPKEVGYIWIRAEDKKKSSPRTIEVYGDGKKLCVFQDISYNENNVAILKIKPMVVKELEIRIIKRNGKSPGIRDYAVFGTKPVLIDKKRIVNLSKKGGGIGKIHILLVDLGKTREISKIVIKHGGTIELKEYNTHTFRVTGSKNLKGPWTPLFDWVKGNTKDITEHTFPKKEVRYLKLEIMQAEQETNFAARIYAFEAYTPEGKNVALVSEGAKAWATSTVNRREIPRFAIDGNDQTKWCGRERNIKPIPSLPPERFVLLPGKVGTYEIVTALQ